MTRLDLLSGKRDTRKYSVLTQVILSYVIYYRQRELHAKWSLLLLFCWKHVAALACFIRLHSIILQTPAVSVGSLVCGNDLFFCRNTNFVLKVPSPVCIAESLNRVNLQQIRPFYMAYEYQGLRFLLLQRPKKNNQKRKLRVFIYYSVTIFLYRNVLNW